MMIDAIDLDVGDHVTTTGLDVQVIAHRRLTPDTSSGISFRLLPSGDTLDANAVTPVTGYSHREISRDEDIDSHYVMPEDGYGCDDEDED